MEFGTREILIVLGIVVIFGILLDGYRRVRRSHDGSLRAGRRKQAIFDDEGLDDLPAELPTGEVRITRRDEQSVEKVSDSIRRYREKNADRQTSAYRERQDKYGDEVSARDTPLEDDNKGRDSGPSPQDPYRASEVGDFQDELEEWPDDNGTTPSSGNEDIDVSLSEFEIVSEDEPSSAEEPAEAVDLKEDTRDPLFASREDEDISVVTEEPFSVEPEDANRPVARRPFWEEDKPVQPAAEKPKAEKSQGSGKSDVIVLHVMAKKGQQFDGKALLEALLANNLRFGSMNIFHRHENSDGSGPVLFSAANSLNPGTFDLAKMEQFETPGVTIFMALSGLKNPLDAYRELIRTAQNIARTLDGGVQDETRSVLTKQTIEHYRQQIIEYTRRSFTLTN